VSAEAYAVGGGIALTIVCATRTAVGKVAAGFAVAGRFGAGAIYARAAGGALDAAGPAVVIRRFQVETSRTALCVASRAD
jgi:hypothetical protein